MLDKKMYHDANKDSLGVKLRAFQCWFDYYKDDLVKIKDKKQPKAKPKRRQNKVIYQADRIRRTPQQKLDLIHQYNQEKANNPD